MKLYTSLADFSSVPSVIATGTFDGVHLGHRLLLSRMKQVAQTQGLETVVCTFHPHPRVVLQGAKVSLLNTLSERIALLEHTGAVDHLVVLPFTRELAKLSAGRFLSEVLIARLGMRVLVMGSNNHIGNGRTGDVSQVQMLTSRLNFALEVVGIDASAPVVSSSAIRGALGKGEVYKAREWLGYPYSLSGAVIEGNRLGRTIGFPTANICVDDESKLIPRQGVYAVRVRFSDDSFEGMLYIGARHVAGEHTSLTNVEVHLFGFDGDLYGKRISVEFVRFLRQPEVFDDLPSLRKQLEVDAVQALLVLG